MRSALIWITALALLLSHTVFCMACGTSDFEILNTSIRRESNYLIIVGTVRNNCLQASGVEVQTAIYGKDKNVLDVQNRWPAGVNNIPPRSDYHFKTMLRYIEGADGYSVVPIRAQEW